MRTFKDTTGREWEIAISIGAIKRVRDLVKLDLLDLADGGTITKLIDDPCLLCDVLWAIVREQAKARDITDEQFGQSLGGDALEHATEALLAELVDFFPQRKRTILAQTLATLKKIEAKMHDKAMATLSDPALMQTIESRLISGASSTSAPESSASTQTG